VWQKVFGPTQLNVTPQDSNLIITEPIFNTEFCQNNMNEVIFEDFCFSSCCRRPAPWFSAYEYTHSDKAIASDKITRTDSCLVVDSGFSFTHLVPFVNLKANKAAVRDNI